MSGLLVLVTGTGRSGTSTIAGSLHHLGLSVPGPLLGANESNPRGFFESRWAVKFHKSITAGARINDFDSRPAAFDLAQQAITPKLRTQLVNFLGKHASESAQVVVKDPRSVWAQMLWKEAAAEVGLDIRYLSMLRHPAEVVGSRTTYYAKAGGEEQLAEYAAFNVARWVNSSLISERETRAETRVFVQYTDLLEDWRSVLTRVRDDLGLTFTDDLDPAVPHPIDSFIDPSLRRHQVGWDELDVPSNLQSLAQSVWDDLTVLGTLHGKDVATSADLDDLSDAYLRLLSEASAIAHDATEYAKDSARRAGVRQARQQAAAAARKADLENRPIADRPVRDVSGRDLLRAAGQRAMRRFRRS